jgi:phospholipase C
MSLVASRRQVLKAGAALGASLALGDLSIIRRAAAASSLPPTGVGAPFDHVVICMMENRSFDHFLGWMAATDPRVDGIQAGLQFTDKKGVTYPTYNLAPDYEGCGYADPDHSWQGGLAQLDSGRMDGFLMTATPGDTLPIGYYTKDTVSVLGTLAQNYGTSDRYFCSILSATYPNRFYQHCARTDRDTTGDSSISTLPAIWDRLQPLASTPVGPAPTGRYYSTDLPFTALFGNKYLNYTFPFSQFLTDCAAGELPNVAFVDPEFLGEGQGFSRDDHPHADVRAGEFFMYSVYNAVRNSPNWNRTVLIFNYDEWGGFYDHIVPPRALADDSRQYLDSAAQNTGMDTFQLGFRVPLAVISPLVPKGTVLSGAPFEHCSVLKMIEWRWNLPPLSPRDANARNLAEILDLQSPPRTDTVSVPVPTTTTTTPCGPTNSSPSPPTPVPEVPWVPGMTVAAAAAAAGWTAVRKRSGRVEAADRSATSAAR